MPEIKPVTIVADSRESRSGIAAALAKFPGVTVKQEELPSGDYIISDGVAVERKSADDLVLSIMDGRFFDQLARLSNEHQKVIFLIEGNPYSTRSAIAPESIDGALSYLSLLSGASVVASPSLAITPRLLWRLAIHSTHGLDYDVPLRAGKPRQPSSIGEYLVAGLPGIGPSMAKRLLSHFGSARAVFMADVNALRKVNGVGEKTAHGIISSLDHACKL